VLLVDLGRVDGTPPNWPMKPTKKKFTTSLREIYSSKSIMRYIKGKKMDMKFEKKL
jgi:hypothetical protein